jgi:hypothetical protein
MATFSDEPSPAYKEEHHVSVQHGRTEKKKLYQILCVWHTKLLISRTNLYTLVSVFSWIINRFFLIPAKEFYTQDEHKSQNFKEIYVFHTSFQSL